MSGQKEPAQKSAQPVLSIRALQGVFNRRNGVTEQQRHQRFVPADRQSADQWQWTGVLFMTNPKSFSQNRNASARRQHALEKWTERIFGVSRIEAGMETMEILTDLAQASELFASLEDLRRGHVVGMSDAFGDL